MQVAQALRTITHVLSVSDANAAVLDAMHGQFSAAVEQLAYRVETSDSSVALEPQQVLTSALKRDPDAAVAASVHAYALASLQRCPGAFGLVDAANLAANCNGACDAQAASIIARSIQPGADTQRLRVLRWWLLQICGECLQPATSACACRQGVVQRLVEGPEYGAMCVQLQPPNQRVLFAAQRPGAPMRRWVLAACLLQGEHCTADVDIPYTICCKSSGQYDHRTMVLCERMLCAHTGRGIMNMDFFAGVFKAVPETLQRFKYCAQNWVKHGSEAWSLAPDGGAPQLLTRPKLRVPEGHFLSENLGLFDTNWSADELEDLGYDSDDRVWFFVAVEQRRRQD